MTPLKGGALEVLETILERGSWAPPPSGRRYASAILKLELCRLVVERDGVYVLGGAGYDAARAAAIVLQQHCAEEGRLTASRWDIAKRLGVIPSAAHLALVRARDLGWVVATSGRRGRGSASQAWSPVVGAEIPRG